MHSLAAAAQPAHRKKERVSAVRRDLERKKERFLELVADGQPVIRAAAEAGLGRRTVYHWRSQDPAFATASDEAYEQGTDLLEHVAQERAINGSDLLLIFLLKRRRPHKYRDNVRHEVDARLTVSVEDAREQLERRLAAIEERRALPALVDTHRITSDTQIERLEKQSKLGERATSTRLNCPIIKVGKGS